jgi:hypothetical protein
MKPILSYQLDNDLISLPAIVVSITQLYKKKTISFVSSNPTKGYNVLTKRFSNFHDLKITSCVFPGKRI